MKHCFQMSVGSLATALLSADNGTSLNVGNLLTLPAAHLLRGAEAGKLIL
ncbi:hypothetical protein SAMN06269173_10785 [Hymenobacter mucosus]|uniref:Uncharacterized protein n=1 Tax=Hymenobacter mucosus TaxID=1411120 RepID=A0A238ZCD5_9BACT|nr:hypothetical protein SAMN06269173_10785 [Hymenobacter mucosus]